MSRKQDGARGLLGASPVRSPPAQTRRRGRVPTMNSAAHEGVTSSVMFIAQPFDKHRLNGMWNRSR